MADSTVKEVFKAYLKEQWRHLRLTH